MINKNVADYTNFGGQKTNNRITQAPGGSSSISLGWDNNSNNEKNSRQYQKNPYNYSQQNGNSRINKYQEQQQYTGYGTSSNSYGSNIPQSTYDTKVNRNNSRQNPRNPIIGGQYGYNNYQPNTYVQNKNPQQYNILSHQKQTNIYGDQRVDPISLYKPSTSSSKKNVKYEDSLEQQKYKLQNSKMQQRNQNPQYPPKQNSKYSHNNKQQYPSINQNSNQTRACVKIHQQKQTSLFGSQYDYWKQDGHNETQANRNNKVNSGSSHNQKIGYQQQQQQQYGNNQYNNGNTKSYNKQQSEAYGYNDKTSVKVHNPPGGKSNFTFG